MWRELWDNAPSFLPQLPLATTQTSKLLSTKFSYINYFPKQLRIRTVIIVNSQKGKLKPEEGRQWDLLTDLYCARHPLYPFYPVQFFQHELGEKQSTLCSCAPPLLSRKVSPHLWIGFCYKQFKLIDKERIRSNMEMLLSLAEYKTQNIFQHSGLQFTVLRNGSLCVYTFSAAPEHYWDTLQENKSAHSY